MPALNCLFLNFFYMREIYFCLGSITAIFEFHLLQLNSVPIRETMILFMCVCVGGEANKPIYVYEMDDSDFDTEIPKIICFSVEDILSYITISPGVG